MSARRRLTAFAVAFTVLVATPLVVTATDRFGDVPETNPHHGDITWLAEAGVTLGCNPPANTNYCPDQAVRRDQMASFLRRLSRNRVVDAATAISAEHADSATEAANADTLDGHEATGLMSSITGSAYDSRSGGLIIPLAQTTSLALATLRVDAAYGDFALVTYGLSALNTASDGRLLAWIQLDDDDCTYVSPDQWYPGSLVIQDMAPSDGGSLAGSIVIPTTGSPGVTLCARSVMSDVGLADSTLSVMVGQAGSVSVHPVGAAAQPGSMDVAQPGG